MMKSEEVVELHAIVRGLVQGVGFRATTRYLASQLKLKGSVRNCSDGSVEIIAQGSKSQVDELITRLKNSPGLGRMEAVEVQYRSPTILFDAFDIRRGGEEESGEET